MERERAGGKGVRSSLKYCIIGLTSELLEMISLKKISLLE